jgi:hypothetical protein
MTVKRVTQEAVLVLTDEAPEPELTVTQSAVLALTDGASSTSMVSTQTALLVLTDAAANGGGGARRWGGIVG